MRASPGLGGRRCVIPPNASGDAWYAVPAASTASPFPLAASCAAAAWCGCGKEDDMTLGPGGAAGREAALQAALRNATGMRWRYRPTI